MEPAHWQSLDLIGEAYLRHANKAGKEELKIHSRKTPVPLPGDLEMMKRFAVAISYSQGSQSRLVARLIEQPIFAKAFDGFDYQKLARRSPESIRAKYWKGLGYLRFRKKIDRIIQCAVVMNSVTEQFKSFAAYLSSFKVPRRIRTQEHIEQFWEGFFRLRKDLRARGMPFFRQSTSLLQLLLDLDYDSAKPDLIVMRLARRIGIVESEFGEKNFLRVVRAFQLYAVNRKRRLSSVDLQVLSFGGQTSARELLEERFCPGSDPCQNLHCPVGKDGLCSAIEVR